MIKPKISLVSDFNMSLKAKGKGKSKGKERGRGKGKGKFDQLRVQNEIKRF